MKFINLILIGLLFSTLTFAQNIKRQQKMMSTIAEQTWDKEAYLSDLEKRFIPLADQVVKDLKVESVHIDRKTGAISVTGKNGKGGMQTLDGVALGDVTNGDSGADNLSFLPDWLVCTWNWLWGYDCEEEATQVEEDWQQLETAEERTARERSHAIMYE